MNKYEKLENEYPDTLILQLMGGFYKAYGKSALVLHGITNYTLTPASNGYRAAFPMSAKEKLENTFKEKKVNYIFFRKGEKEAEGAFPEENHFLEYAVEPEEPAIKEEVQTQRIAIVEGIGINNQVAYSALKKNLEEEITGKGYRIAAISITDKLKDSYTVLTAMVIYE